MFMTPRNHLLQPHGTVVDCNPMIQPAYLLHKQWYALHPLLTTIKEPDMLNSKTKHSWLHQAPGNVATAGIYSQNQLDNLKRQVMYPSER